MEPIVILIGVFAIFIPALMLPGPDFIAVVRSSVSKGSRAGLLTTIGVTIGLCFYATLSLLGLSAILQEYQWMAWFIRILGGGYLIYLGLRMIFTKSQKLDLSADEPRKKGNPLIFGFLVTLTNPKAVILFTSVFATAITETTPLWLLMTMIGLVVLSSLIWYSLVSLFMASGPMIRKIQNARHLVERVIGVCFVGIGCRLMVDSRNPITP